MPPKKKARLPSLAASTPSIETPAELHPVAGDNGAPAKGEEGASNDILTDPWTDEQEISLFKGMIKWKPVGPFSFALYIYAFEGLHAPC